MRFLLVISLLLSSSITLASQPIDLEVNMKNMGLAYKQAVQSTQLSEFNENIDEFIQLVELSKTASFHKAAQQSLEGLDKVIDKAHQAKQLANDKGLEAAKEPLKTIDSLRKQYHELHEPPGFWELLFGK